jgi:membrane protease YdiL (CAAX protease family)
MTKKKKNLIQLVVATAGVFLMVYAVVLFNGHLLMEFSIGSRMILMMLSQWLLFLVPGILMWRSRESIMDLGFRKDNLLKQLAMGILLALATSLIFTVLPILLGFEDMVGSTGYTKPWQFLYEFIYTIFGVALAEEMIFRGYLFHKLLELNQDKTKAILISSVLFGLFHIVSGNILQVIMTALIGILYCVLREKVPYCTTLSLIILHGMYDALIAVWLFLL